MVYNLAELDSKELIYIGPKEEAAAFKQFVDKTETPITSFRFLDYTERPELLDNVKVLDFTKVVIVKSDDCPARLIPAPYITPTQVLLQAIKSIGARIIGVTGTRGKTTTSALIYMMLKQHGLAVELINDLSENPFSSIDRLTDQHTVVIELSSMALSDVQLSPDIAVITNLYRDHIDYHGSLEKYWEAKRNIMRFMGQDGMVVFAPETEIVLHWMAESEAKQVLIDPNENIDMSKSKLIGPANKRNVILAKKVATTLGVDVFGCMNVIANFQPLPHRLQNVRTIRGITFIDNSIAADPSSTLADITDCVREVGPVGCVMMGGKDGSYDFTDVTKLLSTLLIPKLVLFPETAEKIKASLPEGYTPDIFETTDMYQAVGWVADNCPSGSVCLLSSGSPSGAAWKDYQEKGGLFQKAVLGLSNL